MKREERAGRAQLFVSDEAVPETQLGESRWPPALAVSVFLAISTAGLIWLPDEGTLHVLWLVPTVAGILLLLLLTRAPPILGVRRGLHRLAVILVGKLVVAALWAKVALVSD